MLSVRLATARSTARSDWSVARDMPVPITASQYAPAPAATPSAAAPRAGRPS